MADELTKEEAPERAMTTLTPIGGTAIERALAAKEIASVQARYVMAAARPRSWMEARTRILRECERPGFAEAAWYSKPIGAGKSVGGLSIRFAEAAARYAGNVLC